VLATGVNVTAEAPVASVHDVPLQLPPSSSLTSTVPPVLALAATVTFAASTGAASGPAS
jgi:hypothetical protein